MSDGQRSGTIRRAAPIAFLVALLAAIGGSGWARDVHAADGPAGYVVVYRSVSDPDAHTDALERAHGFTTEFRYRHALQGFAATLDARQLAAVEADPSVAFVSPDVTLHAVDALAPGESTPTGTLRTAATTATTAQPAASVNVAVIDTGIDLNYGSELNAVAGKNCINSANPPQDDNGHGSHVSGTIAARNTGTGVVGIAPGTKLYAVKVLDASGSGSTAQVICGIDWVTQNAAALNIRVANMSLGGAGSNDNNCGNSNADAMHTAICNSVAAGVSYVVAAGNSGANFATSTPAAYPEAVTVTAVSDSDGLPGATGGAPTCRAGELDDRYASFSNFAGSSDTVAKAHTVAAPGVCINSTWTGGGYNTISGTSMATPHVSGAVALCISRGACTAGGSPSSIISAIRTTDPTRGFTGDPSAPVSGRYYGYIIWLGAPPPPPPNGTLTFDVGSSGDDGDAVANNMNVPGATYPPTSNVNGSSGWLAVGTRKSGPIAGGYEVRTGLLRFDTSALPDNATITSAKLRLYVTDRQSANNRKLVAEWYSPANWPIDAADYTSTVSTSASTGTTITALALNAQNDLTLQNLASISLTGLTALRLHIDGAQPTGENAVWIASLDDGTLPRPQLVVDYTTSATPPSNTSPPTISGTAVQGQTLTANPGSWAGTPPISFAYEWRRCDAGGNACGPIGGAALPSYTLAMADVGSTIRVRVTGTNSFGSAFTDSAATDVVTAPPSGGTLTFDVGSSGDDGDAVANNMNVPGATYPPTSNVNGSSGWLAVGTRKSGPIAGGYEVRTGLLRFDTSALPDNATITSAKLRLYVTDRQSANNRKLVAEWYSPANWPIDAADYTSTVSTSASTGTTITALALNAQNDLTLQNLASISLTGLTALRLHIDGAQPTGENAVWIASLDDGTLPRPQLVVTYSVP